MRALSSKKEFPLTIFSDESAAQPATRQNVLRPQGASGVRLFAAAFENSPMCLFFKSSRESGSKLPHL
jgi:hypothetical protein